MWQEILALVSRVAGPLEKTTAGGAEMCLATSGTAVLIAIPSWMLGKYCEFTATAADCDVLFGTSSSLDVEYANANSVDGTTKVVTTETTTGRRIVAGTTRSWIVPKDATHISFEASGAGFLYIGRSSQKIEK